ncbi:ral guanine nucleotide dissociation stimulator-like 1 [Thomomys bottae]
MPQDKLRNALSSILDMWLDEYWEDFCQPAHFACLKQLLAHLKRHMTGTHVESRAQRLLDQMEAQEPSQTQPDGSTGEGLNKEKNEVLDFPPLLVAEQLTRMDSVHIKGTVPYLKTFLGDFQMIDTAFRDFLDVSSLGITELLGLG